MKPISNILSSLTNDFRNSCQSGITTPLCVSKFIGYVGVLGSCFYKAPVIIKIIRSGNSSGLNILSIYMETSAYSMLVLYNYMKRNAPSTYGDYCMSSIQNLIIISLIWMWGFGPKDPKLGAFHIQKVVGITVLAIAVLYQFRYKVSENIELAPFYAYSVITMSRVPQIIRNYRTGTVGVQSMITLSNAVLGSCKNVYISVYETKDFHTLCGNVLLLLLNLTLALQVLLLKDNTGNKTVAKSKVRSENGHHPMTRRKK